MTFELVPRIRLACVILLLAAVFCARSLTAVLTIYAFAFIAVGVSGVTRRHMRFVIWATLPLLVALLVIWGWLLPNQHASAYPNGVAFAIATWLRIVATGAALQAFMIPLIEHPAELHRFLQATRIPTSLAHVMITAVIFLPEVGRRLTRLSEARIAQGYPSGLFARLVAIPQLLMPLVSSLLDTAIKRADFWGHRGVLAPRLLASGPNAPVLVQVAALVFGVSAFYIALSL